MGKAIPCWSFTSKMMATKMTFMMNNCVTSTTNTIITNNNPNTKKEISQHISLQENDLNSDEYMYYIHVIFFCLSLDINYTKKAIKVRHVPVVKK